MHIAHDLKGFCLWRRWQGFFFYRKKVFSFYIMENEVGKKTDFNFVLLLRSILDKKFLIIGYFAKAQFLIELLENAYNWFISKHVNFFPVFLFCDLSEYKRTILFDVTMSYIVKSWWWILMKNTVPNKRGIK